MRGIFAALDVLPGWLWALICSGLIALNAVTKFELKSEQLKHQALIASMESAAAKQSEAYRIKEQEHAIALQSINTRSSHEKNRIAADMQRTIDSLRNRADRPENYSVPTSSADPLACTGASLFRSDAEFLIRESSRADQLRADLSACQAAYDEAVTLTQ